MSHTLIATLNHIADSDKSIRFNYAGDDAERAPGGRAPHGYLRIRRHMEHHNVNTAWPVDIDGFTVTVTPSVAQCIRRDMLGGTTLAVTVRVSTYSFRARDGRDVRGVRLQLENVEKK